MVMAIGSNPKMVVIVVIMIGPEPGFACFNDGISDAGTFLHQLFYQINQYNGIIHHYPGEHDHTDEHHHRNIGVG